MKVSIITVCFNSEESIAKTIESVLEQKFSDFEYIIKDGKSSDSTMDIVRSYKNKFLERGIPYIIISEEDSSLYEAMNIGIMACQGEWINFMNAGDSFYAPNVLNSVFTQDYDEKIAVLYGNNMVEDSYGTAVNKADIGRIRVKMPFNHQASFFREKVIKEYMYDVNLRIGADYDLILTLYEEGKRFEYVDEIISKYQLDGLSSTNFVETARERQLVRNKHGYKDIWLIEKGKIGEAYLKEYLQEYCPDQILKVLNRFYKIHIKRYGNVENRN